MGGTNRKKKRTSNTKATYRNSNSVLAKFAMHATSHNTTLTFTRASEASTVWALITDHVGLNAVDSYVCVF